MDAYPRGYVAEHNLPLVFLSGLGEREDAHPRPTTLRQESGARIATRSPVCAGEKAARVLEQFLNHDGSESQWNTESLPGPSGSIKYRMKAIGRDYAFPPRKAAPLPQSPGIEGPPSPQPMPRSNELHSPLSPLAPGSPIFPDGVFTPLWFAKHQHQVPSCLIAFFDISVDDSTAQNEQIQMDINAIRTALSSSGFKTRFAVILMSDKSIIEAPQLEDRLSAIRRATTLDPKTGLFFMPPMSTPAEIDTFVRGILVTIQPLCVEYYRDLTKHARRKKARGGASSSVSSPIGTSFQTLSTPGWNVRYEVKQGVFAEFRQEMDVAERHYSAAIEEMFNSEGVLETTPIWSPRWNEVRMLCDALAFRVLRCQLYAHQTTGSAVSFLNYQARTRDLINRRGKGTQTYSWSAWEARWALMMAELIRRAGVPAFVPAYSQQHGEFTEIARKQIFAMPEKPVDRLAPFRFLHHAGYWHRLALQWLRTRREQATDISEEDRVPPGQSPASAVSKRHKNYDSYLVPEPHEEFPLPGNKGYDYLADMRRVTDDGVKEFGLRGQMRVTERLRLDISNTLLDSERYEDAMIILNPLWDNSTWRGDGWSDLFGQLLSATSRCAQKVNNHEVYLATAWERLTSEVSSTSDSINLAKCLDSLDQPSQKVKVTIEDTQRQCPVDASFAFGNKCGNVGEPLECQLVLRSLALERFEPLILAQVEVVLDSLRTVRIKHAPTQEHSKISEIFVDLSNTKECDDGVLEVEANLTLSPQQTRIFRLDLTFREAQTLRLKHIALLVDNEKFQLEHIIANESISRTTSLVDQRNGILERRLLSSTDTLTLTVLPKPPKLRLLLHGLQKQHYTDEYIQFQIEFVNDEIEAVNMTAYLNIAGETENTLPIPVKWSDTETSSPELTINDLAASASHRASALLEAPADPTNLSFHVEVNYTVASDPNTSVSKTMAVPVEFVLPFEAKFNLGPRFEPGEWPSYFSMDTSKTENPSGIRQRWKLETEVQSRTSEEVIIKKMDLTMDNKPIESICQLIDSKLEERKLASQESTAEDFEFVIQKLTLDDRRPTTVELSLEITWSRFADSKPVITVIPIPRLTLPSSEPRVLCISEKPSDTIGDVCIRYIIENPSTHFLTFALTMEASEAFAFRGPKFRTLSLAPLSRQSVEYQFVVHESDEKPPPESQDQGRWIWPVLQVLDSYYQKNLKIHPGGPGVKLEEERLGVLVEESK